MSGRPESAVRAKVGCWGAVGALAGVASVGWLGGGAVSLLLALMAGAAGPMWWLEYRRAQDDHRVVTTSQALMGTVTVSSMFIASMLLQLTLGDSKGSAVGVLFLPALAISAVAQLIALVRADAIGSSVVQAGHAVRAIARRELLQKEERVALLGWLVKAIFLPLMLGWALVWLDGVRRQLGEKDAWLWFAVPFFCMYAIDTAFAAIGYISTSRSFDAHIRSVDSTWWGWLSALVCYPPLSVLVLDVVLVYRHEGDWTAWLQPESAAAYVWGSIILALTAIYTWSTIAFGPRFSNLTNRGIITSGPYRWCKHPAYLAKNFSWWLISVPFLPVMGWVQVIIHCLALFGVNAIYYVRARTEERHLRHDPAYVQYEGWIRKNGLFGQLREFLASRVKVSI